jgi:hypothetical protein
MQHAGTKQNTRGMEGLNAQSKRRSAVNSLDGVSPLEIEIHSSASESIERYRSALFV